LVPGAEVEAAGVDLAALAAQLRPELVQLWYQMALNARRDLPYAPSGRAGLEMAGWRVFGSRRVGGAPAAAGAGAAPAEKPAPRTTRGGASAAAAARAALAEPAPASPAASRPVRREPAAAEPRPPAPAPAPAAAPPAPAAIGLDHEGWLALVERSGPKGAPRELAAHAVFLGHDDGVLRLGLSPNDELLNTPASNRALSAALADLLGGTPRLRFETVADSGAETLRERTERARDARQEAAEAAFLADPGVQQLMRRHGATLVPDSIRPHDDTPHKEAR